MWTTSPPNGEVVRIIEVDHNIPPDNSIRPVHPGTSGAGIVWVHCVPQRTNRRFVPAPRGVPRLRQAEPGRAGDRWDRQIHSPWPPAALVTTITSIGSETHPATGPWFSSTATEIYSTGRHPTPATGWSR